MGKGWTLITSPAEKAENNATIRGVGMLLSPKAYQSLNNIEPISSRILIASFNGNPMTNVICCYSPTNSSDEDNVEQFYRQLTQLVKSTPKHNLTVIGGDFSGNIENIESANKSFHSKTNRNAQYLLDFMAECELINLNLQYTKRPGKLGTFAFPNDMKAQLDYILINKKWRNSALNCEPYNTFTSVNSDHRITT